MILSMLYGQKIYNLTYSKKQEYNLERKKKIKNEYKNFENELTTNQMRGTMQST